MIKVLNIISDSNIGGAGRCVLNFLKCYDRQTFQLKVVVPTGSLLVPEIEALGVEVIQVDGIAEKSLDIKAIGKLRKIIKKEKPQIVHTHSTLSGRIAAKLCSGTKIVYTRHSVFPVSKRISQGIGKFINKTLNEFLSDEIIAVAEAAKDNLTEGGISDKKIKVILNGVEPIKRQPNEQIENTKKQYHINESDFVVGILARLNDYKGHSYLIDAANQIKKVKENAVKILIVGTGNVEAELKAKVKTLGLEDTVIFTGFIKDVPKILNIMDLQVNASYGTEATSLALLEGMSLGVPAVVTNYGGNPGVITNGENGLIVETKNAEALAKAILKIVEDDALRKHMQKKSIEIFKQKFDWNIYAQNVENVYKALTKRR
jgi:glycosyltransferase involved in cell wall biosynthesis